MTKTTTTSLSMTVTFKPTAHATLHDVQGNNLQQNIHRTDCTIIPGSKKSICLPNARLRYNNKQSQGITPESPQHHQTKEKIQTNIRTQTHTRTHNLKIVQQIKKQSLHGLCTRFEISSQSTVRAKKLGENTPINCRETNTITFLTHSNNNIKPLYTQLQF